MKKRKIAQISLIVLGCLFLLLGLSGEGVPLAVAFIVIGLNVIAWTIAAFQYVFNQETRLNVLYWTSYVLLSLVICSHFYFPHQIALIGNMLSFYALAISFFILLKKRLKAQQDKEKIKKRKIQNDGPENTLLTVSCISMILFFILLMQVFNFDYQNVGGILLIATVVGVIVYAVVLFLIHCFVPGKLFTKSSIALIIFVLVLCVLFCFVNVSALNIALDWQPQNYAGKVLDKRSSGGSRSKRYYLEIQHGNGEKEEVSVNMLVYQRTDIGDTVTIEYYEGAFGFEYTYVS